MKTIIYENNIYNVCPITIDKDIALMVSMTLDSNINNYWIECNKTNYPLVIEKQHGIYFFRIFDIDKYSINKITIKTSQIISFFEKHYWRDQILIETITLKYKMNYMLQKI